MTVEEQEIKPLFRIYVPSITKENVPIQQDILQNFYDSITERFTRQNGGCNAIINAVGYYLSDAGEIVKEPINTIESTGVFPFSAEEMSFWAGKLGQECIRVEEAGLVKAYHYDGEIEPISNFNMKTNIGSIEYYIDANPSQYIYRGEDKDTEVFEIPEKYVINCLCYDKDGQPTAGGELDESDILEKMSDPECDLATNLLFQSLLKQLNLLNSK